MEAYTSFAKVYDTFMDETPYEEWGMRIREMIEKYGVSKPGGIKNCSLEDERVADELSREDSADIILESERNLVVDLGCGTGTMTELLSSYGFDMIGVDNAEEMLSVAMEKKAKTGSEILYLLQDMRELELYSTVGTVVSVCDSLNYLLEESDLIETFKKVNNYLYPGGVFIFDFNTVYKYETVIGDDTIAENRDECSFIWENFYHPDEEINEYDLTLFVEEEEGLYRKFTETHYQRGYTLQQMQSIAKAAGLEWVYEMDADNCDKVNDYTERIFAVVRECKKRTAR